MKPREQNLLRQAGRGLGEIPRRAWTLALLSAAFLSMLSLLSWTGGQALDWAYLISRLLAATLCFGAIYIAALGIADRPPSPGGYFRFLATGATLVFPLFALQLIGASAELFPPEARVLALVISVAVGFGLSLLAAWPLAQALSPRPVSPLRVFRATRGHRGALAILWIVLVAVSRANPVPDISRATDRSQAIASTIGTTLVDLALLGLVASIIAAAWRFAIGNDPDLG